MLKSFVIILYCAVIMVKSENGRKRNEFTHRQAKLFSFNIVEENVAVDLQFSVPFLRIPVKKTADSAYGMMGFPTINVNPASVVLGGVVLLGSTVILPYLVKKYTNHQENFRFAKLLDNAEFSADALLDLGQLMLVKNNGFGGCPLRVACWAAQKDLAEPRAILSQIINNKLLSSMVNSSAVEDAMISGIHGRSCTTYEPCPLQENHVPLLMNKFSVLMNKADIY